MQLSLPFCNLWCRLSEMGWILPYLIVFILGPLSIKQLSFEELHLERMQGIFCFVFLLAIPYLSSLKGKEAVLENPHNVKALLQIASVEWHFCMAGIFCFWKLSFWRVLPERRFWAGAQQKISLSVVSMEMGKPIVITDWCRVSKNEKLQIRLSLSLPLILFTKWDTRNLIWFLKVHFCKTESTQRSRLMHNFFKRKMTCISHTHTHTPYGSLLQLSDFELLNYTISFFLLYSKAQTRIKLIRFCFHD